MPRLPSFLAGILVASAAYLLPSNQEQQSVDVAALRVAKVDAAKRAYEALVLEKSNFREHPETLCRWSALWRDSQIDRNQELGSEARTAHLQRMKELVEYLGALKEHGRVGEAEFAIVAFYRADAELEVLQPKQP